MLNIDLSNVAEEDMLKAIIRDRIITQANYEGKKIDKEKLDQLTDSMYDDYVEQFNDLLMEIQGDVIIEDEVEEIKVLAAIIEQKEPEDAFEAGQKVMAAGMTHLFNFEAFGSTYTIFSQLTLEDLIGITEQSLDEHPQKYGVPNYDNEDITIRDILFKMIEHEEDVLFGNKVLIIEYI